MIRKLLRGLLLVVCASGLSAHAVAAAESGMSHSGKLSLMTLAPELTPISDYRGDLFSRSTLFGDPGGLRQALYERGIAIDFDLTQVPQGVVSGGRDEEWKYGATADYYLSLDSGRLNLWPGGLLTVHGRTKFGRSVNSQAGTISPVDYAWLIPSADEDSESFLEEYYLTQGLSKHMLLIAGRILFGNVGDTNRFANNERTQFLNTALKNSLLLGVLTSAQSLHGVALQYQLAPGVLIAPFALSRNDEDGVYGSPGGLFSEYSVGGQLTFNWKIAGLPGEILPIGGYSSKDVAELDNPFLLRDLIEFLRGNLQIPRTNGNWVVGFSFDQYLYMPKPSRRSMAHTADFDKEPEGIGVFMRFHYAPQDRNPWNIFLSGGVGGRGVIPGRSLDRYGLGFYALFVSGDLKDRPVLGQLDTEWGMEAFYNLALTPWLQLTGDLQYIVSGFPRVDNAVVLGTRIQMYF